MENTENVKVTGESNVEVKETTQATPAKTVTQKTPTAKAEFLNPLTPGVTYKEFLKSIPNKVTLKNHLKGKLTSEEIEWIEEELKHYKNK